jgi:hypothetical protein
MAVITELIEYELKQDEWDLVINAKAVIEDFNLVMSQTLYDPSEFGPAKCETILTMYDYFDEEHMMPDEETVISLLEDYGDWNPCEEDSYE